MRRITSLSRTTASISTRLAKPAVKSSVLTSKTAAVRAFSTTITTHPTNGYAGPLQAAILDWSGTCADAFVIAPAYAFVEAFKRHKVDISMEEARVPMGLRKDLHIAALTKMDSVREKWRKVHGKNPDESDVAKIFKDFIPAQMSCLPRYTKLIPGTAEAVDALRNKHKLKIGNTTGFQRLMVDVLLADAKKQGYVPDISVAGDEVDLPRPYPFMVFKNMEKFGISPVHSVVKVDDTIAGVGEGLNAGTWTVAVSDWSNYMNINSMEEFESMSKAELTKRRADSRARLIATGCHYVIPDLTHLPGVVEDINRRLSKGERP